MTWQIPEEKLAGDRSITLRSEPLPVAGKLMYLKLRAAAQDRPVKLFICAEAPDWSPVRVSGLTISAPVDEDRATDGASLEEEGEIKLEGAPDPSSGFTLMCNRKGARIEYSDDESDADSEYEYSEVPASRADLLTGCSGSTVDIEAAFKVKKSNNVTLRCR